MRAEGIEAEFGWSESNANKVLRAGRVERSAQIEYCGEIPTAHLLAVADLPENTARKIC